MKSRRPTFFSLRLSILLSATLCSTALLSCTSKPQDAQKNITSESRNMVAPSQATLDELVVQDLSVGSGALAEVGTEVQVHYTGWLYSPKNSESKGEEFDSSLKRGSPFKFNLGQGMVILGWDRGVAGMKVGGKRRLYIPSKLGYGENGIGKIPPNADLVFDVELLGVK